MTNRPFTFVNLFATVLIIVGSVLPPASWAQSSNEKAPKKSKSEAVKTDLSQRKAGLWEIKTKVTIDGKTDPRSGTYERLNIDQRVQLQESLARQGLKIIVDNEFGRVMHACVSKELAAKPPRLFEDTLRQAGCVETETGRQKVGASQTILYSYVCQGNWSGPGKGELSFDSSTHSGWLDVEHTDLQKVKRVIRSEIQAKWLSNDCAQLKPKASTTKVETSGSSKGKAAQ
jgi:Protein of unknown function (DUF3617)